MTSNELLSYLLEGGTLSPDEFDQFLLDQPEEDQYLDYKDGKLTTKPRRKEGRQTIRRWVSGFANAEGGVLILGVDENRPRTISNCLDRIGSEPLDKWAEGLLHDMVSFFSPIPRFEVLNHPQGTVLLIAVARTPQLVPCVTDGRLKYYLRINQSTPEAPAYLLQDLVLGRRQHPVLDLRVIDIAWSNLEGSHYYGHADVRFGLEMENMGLVVADEVEIGLVGWSIEKSSPPRISHHILSYLDVPPTFHTERVPEKEWSLVHTSSTKDGYLYTLRAFEKTRPASLGVFRLKYEPEVQRFTCAVYLLAQGSPPYWYEIEFNVSAELVQSASAVSLEQSSLTRKISERPKIGLASQST